MNLKAVPALRWYFHLYQFVASERLKKNDIELREVHTLLGVVLTTGLVMWAYAFLAYFTISSWVPGCVGFLASTIHLLSPLCYRFTSRSQIPMNILLTAGIIHQGTFALYSGGFDSNIIIWFGILPMIGGLIDKRRGALTWLGCTLLVSFIFFFFLLNGYHFPNLISPTGKVWSQALLVFGWIFLSAINVMIYAGLSEYNENLLQEQSKKIDQLFRVLFHDLANPLGRMSIGLSIAKKQIPEAENNRGIEIAQKASDSMLEITQNIRKMYAVSKGKANVDLNLTSLNGAVEYVTNLYSIDLDRKRIKITYNPEKNEGLELLVEPVSFNNQVLGNIISNAIKFSPPESEIFIRAYPLNQETFAIEVKDHGIGIPKPLLQQLFDLSKKTSRPGTEGETGTGFGMYIMKSFVEMYGGSLVVESLEGKDIVPSGTTVKLILKGEWG